MAGFWGGGIISLIDTKKFLARRPHTAEVGELIDAIMLKPQITRLCRIYASGFTPHTPHPQTEHFCFSLRLCGDIDSGSVESRAVETYSRINTLLKDSSKDLFSGMGKVGEDEHRLISRFTSRD